MIYELFDPFISFKKAKGYAYFKFHASNTFQKRWDRGMFTAALHHFLFEQLSASVWRRRRTFAVIVKEKIFPILA